LIDFPTLSKRQSDRNWEKYLNDYTKIYWVQLKKTY